ncbi:hypothetical protein PORY_002355 [Pneumocystis oryctolagi]|uniref:Uncharacterized protein n=1 Tax=Pneumocystis oryctolagi TaxID=42067 RepID=A0ACB7CGL4_9ASCO|nr:hypothetical protein PORY_002355 [Pneumocystis oryctolagi]
MFSQNEEKNQESMIIEENLDMGISVLQNKFMGPGTVSSSIFQTNEECIPNDTVMIVVDTNVFVISHLSLISDLSKQCEAHNYIILFPWATIQELDGLKSIENTYSSDKEKNMSFFVRKATNFIYHSLSQKGNSIRGQKMTEVMDVSLTGDDSILDCCRYWHEKRSLKTILLSNDKNLAIKAMIHDIYSIAYEPDMNIDSLMFKISKKLDYYSKDKDFKESQDNDMEIDDIEEPLYEKSACLEHVFSSSYMEQDVIPEKADISKNKETYKKSVYFKNGPLPDTCRPFIMEFLEDVVSTILKASETLLKKHMSKALGGDFSAEYILKGYTFPPKCMEDLFQIIQKFWDTIFKELFKTHAYKEKIATIVKTYRFWSRWATLGIGIGPSSIRELEDWVEEVVAFWTVFATALGTEDTAKEVEKRCYITASWRIQIKNLQQRLEEPSNG